MVPAWTGAIIVDGLATSFGDPCNFTRGTGGTTTAIYGYYITDGQSGPLCWAEAAPSGPVPFGSAGLVVVVTPQLALTAIAS